MKKILTSIVLISLLFLGDTTLEAKPKTSAAAEASATPWVVKKKFNFWEWLLGPRKSRGPASAPTPEPTPERTPSKHRVTRKSKPAEAEATRTPRPSTEKTPAPSKEKSTPAPVVEETPAPAATPEPPAVETSSTPAPAVESTPPPAESTEPSAAEEAPAPAISSAQEAKEKAQYRTVRAKALEDKQIQDLRDQMDAAVGDEQRQKATKRYYNALFEKMRDIDPSLKERINRMEAAARRRMARSKSGEPSDE